MYDQINEDYAFTPIAKSEYDIHGYIMYDLFNEDETVDFAFDLLENVYR